MKKVLSLFLIIAVLATMVIVPVSAKEFNDIQYSKNEEAIEELYNLGVIEGYGSYRFGPYKTLTRAEACTMVVRAMIEDDLIYSSNSSYFNDVSRDSWYRAYVDTAYRNDLMHGHGHNRFDPNSEVTYIQFATIVLNMLGYNCPELPGEWPDNVEKLVNHLGLDYNVSYYDNNDAILREDAAQMMYNALNCYLVEWNNGVLRETNILFRELFEEIDLSEDVYGVVTWVLSAGGEKQNRYIAHFWMYTNEGEWVEVYDESEYPIHEKDWVRVSYDENGEFESILVVECNYVEPDEPEEPIDPEDPEEPEDPDTPEVTDPDVYVVSNGKSYHMSKECEYLEKYDENDIDTVKLSTVSSSLTPCVKCAKDNS